MTDKIKESANRTISEYNRVLASIDRLKQTADGLMADINEMLRART